MNLPENILFMAFRYALGRMTYVTLDVSTEIINKWDELSDKYKILIQKEIKEAINDDMAGMDMDVEEWEKILKLPK